MRTDPAILADIASFDPDNISSTPPTNNDYHNFRASVIAEYGADAWYDYCNPTYKEYGTYE